MSWMTTSSLMQRGNLVGMMLGIVTMDNVLDQADMLASENDPNAPATGDGKMKPDDGAMKPDDGATGPVTASARRDRRADVAREA